MPPTLQALVRKRTTRCGRGIQRVIGVGVLGVLASAANGPARDELAYALDIEPADGLDFARQLFTGLGDGANGGVGFWLDDQVVPHRTWLSEIDFATVEQIPADDARFAEWISDTTLGLIIDQSIEPSADALMLAISTIATDVSWTKPFQTGLGRWCSNDGELVSWLHRREEADSDAVGVIHAGGHELSHVVVETESNLDVHLIAGAPETNSVDVLDTALSWLDGDRRRSPASELPIGTKVGCLNIRRRRGGDSQTLISLPSFQVKSDIDMVSAEQAFGLVAATDPTRGHFDGISSFPLAVSSATQSVFAGFTDEGFTAGATTVVMLVAGGASPQDENRQVDVVHDRPFGFLAVDRMTDIVHFAGWVATPAALQYPEGLFG